MHAHRMLQQGGLMSGYGFGEALSHAREEIGLSVAQVSTALRIRPDVIRALESEDFANMPAKGFARNQISAYARFLGLDSVEITGSFIAGFNRFESTNGAYSPYRSPSRVVARVSSRDGNPVYRYHGVSDSEQDPNLRKLVRGEYSSPFSEPASDSPEEDAATRRATRARRNAENVGEQLGEVEEQEYDEAPRNRRSSEPRNRRGGSSRQPKQPRSSRSSRNSRNAHGSNRSPRGGHIDNRSRSRSGISSSGRIFGGGRSLKKILLIILILLVIAALAVFVVPKVFNGSSSSNSDVIQVTGSDSEGADAMADTSDDALTDMPDKVEVKATEFGLKVTVADGSSSWVQVDVDGKTPIAEVVTGPQELSYTVTDTASLQIGKTSAVTVTVDGQKVELYSKNGIGVVTLKLKDGKVIRSES